MSPDGRIDDGGVRVVLVKPGDILAIGNLGELPEPLPDLVADLRNQIGLASVWLFAADIDIAAIPGAGPTTGSADA